jgi:hypothetical protein
VCFPACENDFRIAVPEVSIIYRRRSVWPFLFPAYFGGTTSLIPE